MKWNLETFLYSIRERLDEVGSKDVYTDMELTRYLNAAINDMAHELRLEEVATVEAAAQKDFDFRDIFVTEEDLALSMPERDQRMLQIQLILLNNTIVPLTTIKNRDTTGVLSAYTWGNKLYLTQEATGTLEIFYLRKPVSLVNMTDSSEVPELYQHIPTTYVLARCMEKDGEMGQAAEYDRKYMEQKYEMADEIDKREKPEDVSVVTDSFFAKDGDTDGEF